MFLRSLYNQLHKIRENIFCYSISDKETEEGIKEVYSKYKYIIDPHGAVGMRALQKFRKEIQFNGHGIVLETAHPAKFLDIVEPFLDAKIEVPDRLSQCMNKDKSSVLISKEYNEFKALLEMQIDT